MGGWAESNVSEERAGGQAPVEGLTNVKYRKRNSGNCVDSSVSRKLPGSAGMRIGGQLELSVVGC